MTRARSCGGQVATGAGTAAERRRLQCHWQKAGQNTSSKAMQQGQCLQLLCKLWHGAPAPSEPAHIDAGALAGAQLWPPHSLNAGA
jgi:hypothetical protein